MDPEEETFFSRVVGQFLEQNCKVVPDKSVRGQVLFHRFRDYWNEVTHETAYPALLGQLHVELIERGYTSSGGKWPRWYNLTLRRKKSKRAAKKVGQQILPAADTHFNHAQTSRTYDLAHFR